MNFFEFFVVVLVLHRLHHELRHPRAFFFLETARGYRRRTEADAGVADELHKRNGREVMYHFLSRVFLNFVSSQLSTTSWSSIVPRRISESRCIRSGAGNAVFCKPSLQFVQIAFRLEGSSEPPFDLSIICPSVRRIFLSGWKGSGSEAANPQLWHVKPFRLRTYARVSFDIPLANAG